MAMHQCALEIRGRYGKISRYHVAALAAIVFRKEVPRAANLLRCVDRGRPRPGFS